VRFLAGLLLALTALAPAPRHPPERTADRSPRFVGNGLVAFERTRASGTVVADLAGHVRTLGGSLRAWAPDGSRVALATKAGIVVRRLDGAERRVFAGASQPTWSRDGTRLALATDTAIIVAAGDGSSAHPIGDGLDGCGPPACVMERAEPEWSPDASQIAFLYVHAAMLTVNPTAAVFVVPREGGDARRLDVPYVCPFGDGSIGWSVGGEWLAALTNNCFDDDFEVELIRSDGSVEGFFAAVDFAWAPRGTRLAADTARGVTVTEPGGRPRLFPRTTGPAWAPSGDRLALVRGGSVAVVSLDSGRVHALARGTSPVWSADGRWIAYAVPACGPRQGIHLVRPDGRHDHRLTALCQVVATGPGPLAGTRYDDEIWAADDRPETISCGAGRDVVHADARDAIRGDCERIVR
jgi:hypothetical protein